MNTGHVEVIYLKLFQFLWMFLAMDPSGPPGRSEELQGRSYPAGGGACAKAARSCKAAAQARGEGTKGSAQRKLRNQVDSATLSN